jgi:formamidopyrimidine-DNA glycosylase
MPELPEVEAVRQRLERSMRGKAIARVVLRRPDLRRPFPADFVSRLEGQTVRSLRRRGKYLLFDLSSTETLLVHLGMSGSFRITKRAHRKRGRGSVEPVSSGAHDHVAFELANGSVVTFNDPRRFGLMDVLAARPDVAHRALLSMGAEPLDGSFDAQALARGCANRRTALKVVLLDQRVVAGLGNIYASEALHRAALSPRRKASSVATSSGRPRPAAFRLVRAIKTVLRDAIARQERPYRSGDFRVYERAGARCPRPGCGGTIRRLFQAGRSTFFCPKCQR